MKTWNRAGRLADLAPPERNRYVDFLRAASITVVVVGHWLMAAPELRADGELVAGHVLADLPWTQWLTWAFQVMPVFFMVGGYANAVSWRSARRHGTGYGTWLHSRLRRLALPVIPLILAWTGIAAIGLSLGLDPELIRLGSQTALVPVWFLAVYIAVASATPLLLAAWERWGWLSFAVGAVSAVAVDAVSLLSDNQSVGWANYLFIWGSVHQLGFAWRDSRIGGPRRSSVLAIAGLVALVALVTIFDYPVSMVGVPGADANNTVPPRLPLLALGLLQTGVLLAVEEQGRRLLETARVWTATVLVNSMIMTIYLWHLTAMVLVLGVALGLGGTGLRVTAGTAEWWLTRPIWLAVMLGALLPFLTGFSGFERPRRAIPSGGKVAGIGAVIMICSGLGSLAYFGIGDSTGVNWPAVILALAGAVVGRVAWLGTRDRPVPAGIRR